MFIYINTIGYHEYTIQLENLESLTHRYGRFLQSQRTFQKSAYRTIGGNTANLETNPEIASFECLFGLFDLIIHFILSPTSESPVAFTSHHEKRPWIHAPVEVQIRIGGDGSWLQLTRLSRQRNFVAVASIRCRNWCLTFVRGIARNAQKPMIVT